MGHQLGLPIADQGITATLLSIGQEQNDKFKKISRKNNACRRSGAVSRVVSGGAPKRPYPLAHQPTADFPVVVDHDSDKETVCDLTSTLERNVRRRSPGAKPITLIYHGSFGPFHVGHREGLREALAHVASHGGRVNRAIIGFTTQRQYEKKVPGCQ
eukprot:5631873-Amphidinium_carterae.1